MEAFTAGVPNNWAVEDPSTISQVQQPNRVHSGTSAVNLQNGAVLAQIAPAKPGRSYDLSFFTRGEGCIAGMDATVQFINDSGVRTPGLTLSLGKESVPYGYNYYRGITIPSPSDTLWAEVAFSAHTERGHSLDLDDVSLILR